MTVKVTGVRDFKVAMRRLGASFNDAVDDGVFVTANEVRNYAIKSIQESSPGQTVQRSKQGGGGSYSHVAAAPGQAPNTDTGKLVASIAVEPTGDMRYSVGSSLPYATYLEFGTSQMSSRPWLNPALNAKGFLMSDNIAKTVQIAIDRIAQ